MTHPELAAEDAVAEAAARWRGSGASRSNPTVPKSRSSEGGVGPGQIQISRNDGSKLKGPPTPPLIDSLLTMDRSCLVCGETFKDENWRSILAQHMGQHWLAESNAKLLRDQQTAEGSQAMAKGMSGFEEARNKALRRARTHAIEAKVEELEKRAARERFERKTEFVDGYGFVCKAHGRPVQPPQEDKPSWVEELANRWVEAGGAPGAPKRTPPLSKNEVVNEAARRWAKAGGGR